ncbi:MAG: FAD-dependent oxidoreductase [Capsulimonadaceae bacterium]|nr:FAD-dependent oxidoreductase [Capsulimonadaceae bacterium]
MKTVHEPSREIPVARTTDVLVCGGGPAGIAAAFTARRAGASVLLIERHPFLGGVWTAGALTILIDTERKSGLNRKIVERLRKRSAVAFWKEFPEWPVYGVEAMKGVLDDMVDELDLDVQLYTNVAAVASEGRKVTGVFTESKSGREFIDAKVVIDTTGDGDVAALAGCPFEMGRPGDGKMQPMTLYGRVGGYRGAPVHIEPILSIARSAGFEPSYGRVTLFEQPGQPGVFMLMATHKYGSAIDVRNLTRVEFEARREIRQLVEILQKHGGPDWADAYLIDTGPFIGVREGRRILGRYYLTYEDLECGRKFEDGICRVGFGVDIHHPDPEEGRGLKNMKTLPYDIPYRSLLAQGVDNLMMAGRCISGDHIAMASYRVTGDAVAMGEAAGLAAAIACETGVTPTEIDIAELRRRLEAAREREAASVAGHSRSPAI